MTERAYMPLLLPKLPSASELLPYLECIDANRFYTNFGPLNKQLLDRLSQWQSQHFGREVFGATTSSATLGLELLLTDLRLPPGSHVLLPALTFIATAAAIVRCGLLPVVADVDAESWLLTPDTLPADLDTRSLGAVMPVAAFGMPQDSQAWSEWSDRTGVPVIIDAAAAFGAQPTAKNVPVVFSLHATKSLSTGEGGLVLTEDQEQSNRIKLMSNFGIGASAMAGGTNAKMSEYHAAVGLASLDAWPEVSRSRRLLYEQYQTILSNACGEFICFQKNVGLRAPCTMLVMLDNHSTRLAMERICEEEGIQTRRWYQPLIHQHPAAAEVLAPFELPRAHSLAQRLLGLPFHLDMNQDDMSRVADALSQACSACTIQELNFFADTPLR